MKVSRKVIFSFLIRIFHTVWTLKCLYILLKRNYFFSTSIGRRWGTTNETITTALWQLVLKINKNKTKKISGWSFTTTSWWIWSESFDTNCGGFMHHEKCKNNNNNKNILQTVEFDVENIVFLKRCLIEAFWRLPDELESPQAQIFCTSYFFL